MRQGRLWEKQFGSERIGHEEFCFRRVRFVTSFKHPRGNWRLDLRGEVRYEFGHIHFSTYIFMFLSVQTVYSSLTIYQLESGH